MQREHLPDRLRFKKPYVHCLDPPSKDSFSIKQAQFKAAGFASTGERCLAYSPRHCHTYRYHARVELSYQGVAPRSYFLSLHLTQCGTRPS